MPRTRQPTRDGGRRRDHGSDSLAGAGEGGGRSGRRGPHRRRGRADPDGDPGTDQAPHHLAVLQIDEPPHANRVLRCRPRPKSCRPPLVTRLSSRIIPCCTGLGRSPESRNSVTRPAARRAVGSERPHALSSDTVRRRPTLPSAMQRSDVDIGDQLSARWTGPLPRRCCSARSFSGYLRVDLGSAVPARSKV